MPKIESTSRISSFSIENSEELSKELDKIYEKLAEGINTKSDMIVSDDASPHATDDADFEIGTMWVKSDSNQVYVLTSKSLTGGPPTVLTAMWTEVS